MIVARLDFYGATISGWETQQASGDFDAITGEQTWLWEYPTS